VLKIGGLKNWKKKLHAAPLTLRAHEKINRDKNARDGHRSNRCLFKQFAGVGADKSAS